MTPLLSTALMRTQSDARLVALAAAGHERAFEAIVERHRRPLLRHCRRYLSEARAEDAVQQVFLSAWSALQAGIEVRDLPAWLHRIARNAALNAAQRQGYDFAELRDSLSSLHGDPIDDLERRQVMQRTLAGLAALPERQREALLRTALAGDSRADIARDLGLSEGAVRQLVHRARTTMRAAATAITPLSLAGWAVGGGSGDLHSRIPELVAAGGAAGGTATLAKAGTAVVVAGALAGGAVTGPLHRGPQSAAEPAVAEAAGPPRDRDATPKLRTTAATSPTRATGVEAAPKAGSRSNTGQRPGRRDGAASGEGSGRRDGEDRSSETDDHSGRDDDRVAEDHAEDRTDDHSASGGDDGVTDDHSGEPTSGGDGGTDSSGPGSGSDDPVTTTPATTEHSGEPRSASDDPLPTISEPDDSRSGSDDPPA